MTENEQELFRRAVRAWGLRAQILMLVEEMAELTQELCRMARPRERRNLAEEVADVEIMLDQLRVALPYLDAAVKRERSAKVQRLAHRLMQSNWPAEGPDTEANRR